MGKIAAALMAAALVLVPPTGVLAQTDQGDLAVVEIVRYGGPDRYSTSLLVAEAFAEDAGGSLEWVILVSGRSWHEAVVASSLAGSLGAPVLMTPPHEVRGDALEFLERVGASKALLISTDSGDRRTIGIAVDEQLRDAGLTVERIGGGSWYDTGIAVAERLGEVGELGTAGKTAIFASGEVFADALVAGPLSARARIPVLLSPRAELHVGVAEYLESAGIERVVLMGGTAALSDEVEEAIGDLDLAIDRMAGRTRFETATLTAEYAAEQAGEGCFSDGKAGLARARVPFDSFSAAPLLARHCATLVLTEPGAVPESTAGYLDDTRRTVGDSTAALFLFGGEAAVSRAAIDAYLVQAAEDDDSEMEVASAGSCGGASDDPPVRLLPGERTAKQADWSPDCKQIALALRAGLWVMDYDGSNAREILLLRNRQSISNPAWSPDGMKIAFEVSSWHGSFDNAGQRSHIYVANADGTNVVKLTAGETEDRNPAWSPDGGEIAFERNTWEDRTVFPPIGEQRFIAVMDADGSNLQDIGRKDAWNTAPAWSPDGAKFAMLSGNGFVSVMNADGSGARSHWQVPGMQAGNSVRLHGANFSDMSWSPDSTQIAFAWKPTTSSGQGPSPPSGTIDIAALNIETGNLTVITSMEGTELNPDWSPDGQRILFNTDADQGATTRIYVVGAGGAATGES